MSAALSFQAKRVLVAGLQDWHLNAFATAIASDGWPVSVVNDIPAVSADLPILMHRGISGFYRLWRKISPAPFFENDGVYHAMRAFDRHAARVITNTDVDAALLWSGMARSALVAARRRGVRTFLVMGNSRLDLFEKRMVAAGMGGDIPAKWKIDQEAELLLADAVIVESAYVASGLTDVGVDRQRIHILPPHVSVPPETGGRSDPSILRFCQVQPIRRKGVHLLARWWATLHPAPELLLIGKFDPRDLGDQPLPSSVRPLGYLVGSRYDQALESADVALFPTFEDGGPRAMIECMARGLCVIASPYSAAPDHITNYVNGFVIPLERKDRWIDQIRWCADNPQEVRRIGLRAREYVASRLSLDHLAKCWNEILASASDAGVGTC